MASPSFDGALRLFLIAHYLFHAFNMAYSDPERYISTGVHQTVTTTTEKDFQQKVKFTKMFI